MDTDYSFQGIGYAEAADRDNELRTGVPPMGAPALLQHAPIKRLARVKAVNTGKESVYLRCKHGGKLQTQTNEQLAAAAQGSHVYTGSTQFAKVTPSSVSITNANGAVATIVDDGNGNLVDTGTTTKRGTINYVTGAFTCTYGGSETAPVRVSYTHTDYVEFASAAQTITDAGGSDPHTIALQFGRVVPGSVALGDGTHTWVDDGKGNIIQTDTSIGVKGTIDYATGIITMSSGTAIGASTASTFKFNPFAALIAAGAGTKLMDIFGGGVPELTAAPYGAGIKNETNIGLFGDGHVTSGKGSNIITTWTHYGEEPWRVTDDYSSFPVGGDPNNPALSQTVDHL